MGLAVAIDTTPLSGERTGIGRYVSHVVEALDRLAPGPDRPNLRPYVLSRRATDLPNGTRRLPYHASVVVRLWGHLDRPTGASQLAGADLVHGTNYIAPPSGLPTLLTIHDCSFVTNPEWCRPVVRAFSPAVKRAVRNGAWIHTPSHAVADQVRHIFATDRVRVVHHGPPDPLARPEVLPDLPGLSGEPFVLALSSLDPRKNHVRLVEAFGLVQERHRDLRLVLAGPNGPARPAIEEAIGRLSREAAANVIITGWLDDEHRVAALSQAQVLAYPSLDEGFGLPLLEAMQAGVPVVAADVGSIGEVSGGAALLIDPNDPTSLAAGLETALTDAEVRGTLIAAGSLRVNDFSWQRCAAGLVELYGLVASEAS